MLDTTYTGKALAGLLARRGDRRPVLFVNTFNSRPLDDLPEADPPGWIAGRL